MPSANMPTTVKTNATLRLAIPAHVSFLASRKIASVNRTSRNENKEKPSVQIVMTPTIYAENVPHTASCDVKGVEDQVPSKRRRGSQDADGFGQLRRFLVLASS
jgi:hypothetical protein